MAEFAQRAFDLQADERGEISSGTKALLVGQIFRLLFPSQGNPALSNSSAPVFFQLDLLGFDPKPGAPVQRLGDLLSLRGGDIGLRFRTELSPSLQMLLSKLVNFNSDHTGEIVNAVANAMGTVNGYESCTIKTPHVTPLENLQVRARLFNEEGSYYLYTIIGEKQKISPLDYIQLSEMNEKQYLHAKGNLEERRSWMDIINNDIFPDCVPDCVRGLFLSFSAEQRLNLVGNILPHFQENETKILWLLSEAGFVSLVQSEIQNRVIHKNDSYFLSSHAGVKIKIPAEIYEQIYKKTEGDFLALKKRLEEAMAREDDAVMSQVWEVGEISFDDDITQFVTQLLKYDMPPAWITDEAVEVFLSLPLYHQKQVLQKNGDAMPGSIEEQIVWLVNFYDRKTYSLKDVKVENRLAAYHNGTYTFYTREGHASDCPIEIAVFLKSLSEYDYEVLHYVLSKLSKIKNLRFIPENNHEELPAQFQKSQSLFDTVVEIVGNDGLPFGIDLDNLPVFLHLPNNRRRRFIDSLPINGTSITSLEELRQLGSQELQFSIATRTGQFARRLGKVCHSLLSVDSSLLSEGGLHAIQPYIQGKKLIQNLPPSAVAQSFYNPGGINYDLVNNTLEWIKLTLLSEVVNVYSPVFAIKPVPPEVTALMELAKKENKPELLDFFKSILQIDCGNILNVLIEEFTPPYASTGLFLDVESYYKELKSALGDHLQKNHFQDAVRLCIFLMNLPEFLTMLPANGGNQFILYEVPLIEFNKSQSKGHCILDAVQIPIEVVNTICAQYTTIINPSPDGFRRTLKKHKLDFWNVLKDVGCTTVKAWDLKTGFPGSPTTNISSRGWNPPGGIRRRDEVKLRTYTELASILGITLELSVIYQFPLGTKVYDYKPSE